MGFLRHPVRCYGSTGCTLAGESGDEGTTHQSRTTNLFERVNGLVHFKKPVKETTACQLGSLLFHLPLELREEIWTYVLHSPGQAYTAHFHIYNDVYDSCTYLAQSLATQYERRAARQTALLRTCHAIHDEAVQKLYDTHFELVLFNGHVRPADLLEPRVVLHNLRRRNCLGGSTHWSYWARIRYATIVVQPGRFPRVSSYACRLDRLLNVLSQSVELQTLNIKFNLRRKMEVSMYARDLIKPFLTLRRRAGMQRTRVTLEPCTPRRGEAEFRSAIEQLQVALGLEAGEVVFWKQHRNEYNPYDCMVRSAYGEFLGAHHMPLWKEVSIGLGVFVCLPIIVPLGMGYQVWRKWVKGETWKLLRE